jgi:cytidine deaminase
MLDIPAELAALIRAVHHNDTDIVSVETTVDDPSISISPIVLKILADHSARTGSAIHYTICDKHGSTLFETYDARAALPGYTPTPVILTSLATREFSEAKISASAIQDDLETTLRNAAIAGITRNFPTYNSASGYGAAVRTTGGDIYFGGQYSAFDQRLGIHAEMAVLTHAFLDGATGFTHLSLASTKFQDSPASPCGCCRQFIAESARATDSNPQIHLFASETDAAAVYILEELLPVQWTNKK